MSRSAKVRAELDHPVIDADGHLVEHPGVLKDFLADLGRHYVDGFDRLATTEPIRTRGDADLREPAPPWWVFPTGTHDRATVIAPGLLAERLDEFGIDFSILYPSSGLAYLTIPDPDLRVAVCRAVNAMNRELTAPYSDRMTPAALVPMHTPTEAAETLTHAVTVLGLKAAVIPPGVTRPIPALERGAPDAFPAASWTDWYGLDSLYDYDTVWETFRRLEVAVTVHGSAGIRYLSTARRSPTNYGFNHIGAHAFLQGEVCRALFMGGVTSRFPDLTFAFLEGGVSWAVQQLADTREHWEKRNVHGLANYDPARLDVERLHHLLVQYGGSRFRDAVSEGWVASSPGQQPVDDWRSLPVVSEDQLSDLYVRSFYFGCEADDRGVGTAFPSGVSLHERRFRVLFSSDIAHWDVVDMTAVLAESYELVEQGLLSAEQFRDFTCTYPAELHLRMNPRFFDGTLVANMLPANIQVGGG